MRITNSMMSSRYVTDLNKQLSNMDTLSKKVETGRAFFKGSEDPVAAVKAYKLRRKTADNEDVKTNLDEADSQLTSAESSLMSLKNYLTTVKTQTLKGINGTLASSDRKIISKELENIQETMVNTLNTQYNDKYVFGGTSMDTPPFTTNDSGDLIYKGINISTVSSSDTAAMDELDELSNEKFYMDLGLSLNIKSDGSVNENSVFNISMPGISFLGYGTSTKDGDTVPNNIYDIIGKIRDNLESDDFDFDSTATLIKQFDDKAEGTLKQITTIGTKTKYIDFLKTRADTNEINLATNTDNVEYVDTANAIMDWKMTEFAYNSSLSMGSKLLQRSFIDYMS